MRDAFDDVDAVSREPVQVFDYAYNGSRVIERAVLGSTAEHTCEFGDQYGSDAAKLPGVSKEGVGA